MQTRWLAVTAVAPVMWGANYVVTRQLLPADTPLWGAALRAVPAGLVLLLAARRLPRGVWWWRSAVLGTLNVGAFFLLIYLASQLLPSSVASSVMALSPLTLAGAAWLLAGERPGVRLLLGATAGVGGVLLVLGAARGGLSAGGLSASAGALLLFSAGAALAKRWNDGTPLLASTAWQLLAGGGALTVVAVVVEGGPPTPDGPMLAGYAFTAFGATALANLCWYVGITRVQVGVAGVIGLLNPLTGVALGTVVAHETLTGRQWVGLAVALVGILLVVVTRPAPRADLVGVSR